MRTPLLVFFFVLTVIGSLVFSNALAQQDIPLFWANRIGSSEYDYATNILVDNSGDIYVTGSVGEIATLTPSTSISTLPFYGNRDAIIAKYNALGNVQYVHTIGSADSDGANAVVADSLGNIYVTGWFTGTVDFDPSENTFELTSDNDNADAFLAKYDLNGNFIFANRMGGNFDDYGRVLAIDADANIYLGGTFTGTADFDPSENTENLSSQLQTSDVFLAKYDSDGNFIYANSMGGWSLDLIEDIAVDKHGFVYITGGINGTAHFGCGLIGDVQWESYIAKYTPDGDCVYSKSFGGSETGDTGFTIAVDSLSNVYVAGTFQDTGDFDPGPNEALLYSEGYLDMFLAKYDENGDYVFAKRIGGAGLDQPQGLAMDEEENLYLTGRFNLTVDFDPGPSIDTIINTTASFIAKYDKTGKYQYAQSTYGPSSEYGRGIAVFGEDNIYVTGTFWETPNFANNGATETLTSAGYQDVYIARYTNNPTSIEEFGTLNGVQAFFSNNYLMLSYLETENLTNATVQLFDLTGKVVLTQQQPIASGINTISNLNGIANGIYLLKLTANNQIYTTKLVRL